MYNLRIKQVPSIVHPIHQFAIGIETFPNKIAVLLGPKNSTQEID
jgi:hypothetical protein